MVAHERICNKNKWFDHPARGSEAREIFNIWTWDLMERITQGSLQIGVEGNVQLCHHKGLWSPLELKVRTGQNATERKCNFDYPAESWCNELPVPGCSLLCALPLRQSSPGHWPTSCLLPRAVPTRKAHQEKPARQFKTPLFHKGHIQRLFYGFISFYKQQDI